MLNEVNTLILRRMAKTTYFDMDSARLQGRETACDEPLWISRTDSSSIDTLTAIRATSAVLISRYTYSDSIAFDPTVAWSGLLPTTMVGGTGSSQESSISLDETLQLGNLLDQVDRHASRVLSMNDADFQTIHSATPSENSAAVRVTLVIHRKGLANEDIFHSIENGMLNGSSSLIVECVPFLDASLLCVRLVGLDVSLEESKQLRSSFQQIFSNMLDSARTESLHSLFTINADNMKRIWKWNGAPLQTVDAFVHHLIEQQTREQPDSTAIHSWEGDVTYAELDNLSSQLAAHLANDRGVGPDKFVPLYFEKSMWTVVAMLAVLKAGGAFVPLDPAHPISRMKEMVSQVRAEVVLTSPQHAGKCANIASNVCIVSRASLQDLKQEKDFYLSNDSILAAAYVIFTSGSTGNPKGVVIEHRQVSTSSVHGGRAMGFESKPRMLQFASYTFDACILEVITTLVYGGCVCVPSDWQRSNDIVGFMNTARVTCAFFTPSLLVNIAPEELQTLDTVILGGESVPSDLVADWSQRVRLIIAYGPTECCVICCTLDTSTSEAIAKGDIGYPVGGRPWIVDPTDTDTLAPVGTVGELLIEGPILARGYINDECKTAAAFIRNPRWMRRAARLYKTGDLVRYNADGGVNFVCRKDNQVKLRGQRLELGEVEQQIRRCLYPLQVDVAAEVVTPTDGKGAPFLAAFIYPVATSKEPSNEDARNRPVAFARPGSTFGNFDRPGLTTRTSSNFAHRPESLLRQTSNAIGTTRPYVFPRSVTSTFRQVPTNSSRRATSSPYIDTQLLMSAQQSSAVGRDGHSIDETNRGSHLDGQYSRNQILRSGSAMSSSSRSSVLSRSDSSFSVWSMASSRTESSVVNDSAKPSGTPAELLAKLLPELREALTEKIPAYMVPSIFIQVKEMPLTISGKTDRRQLRKMVLDFSPEEVSGTSKINVDRRQMTEVEKQMQVLWTNALKLEVESVTLDSNFFQLGGDSITGMRVVAAARRSGLSLTMENIFKFPKLSELSAIVDRRGERDIAEPKPIDSFSLITMKMMDPVLKLATTQCRVREEMIEDIYPCTPLQAGMLALSNKAPGTYIMRFVYSLPPSLNVERFKDAWQAIAARNPILRTRYVQTAEAELLQVVLKNKIEWREFSDASNQSPAYLGLRSSIGAGKPLASYSIGRNFDTGSVCFVWEVHHALLDGWSLPLITESVEEAYSDQKVQAHPAFNEFVKHISELDLQACETFWRTQLDGASTPVFPTLPSATYQPQTKSCFQHQVRLMGKLGSGITIATLVRAAWSLLVANYSDSDDIIYGVTLSGRNAQVPGIESLIGPTITTVPLRVRLDRSQKITDYLEGVQKQAAEMMPFEHLGLSRIQRLDANATARCAFQNLLVIQPAAATQAKGIEKDPASLFEQKSESTSEILDYGLVMECILGPYEVQLCARYDAGVIDAIQMERILQQFEHIILELTLSSEVTRLCDIEVISPADVAEIRHWNGAVPKGHRACLPDLIHPHVQTQPESPAICAWDGVMTYQRLYTLSARLGQYLRNIGVKPGVFVPLCFEKSLWAVVSMLAVFIAGGACVPLDPCHPVARRNLIMDDIEAWLLICSPRHEKSFKDSRRQLLVVDFNFIETLTGEIPTPSGVVPTDPAYVIFTSGSTGQPKGILIEHEAFCTSIQYHGQVMMFNQFSRVLQFAAFTFDISFSDIFTTLAHGGCVCIPSDDDRMDDLEGAIRSLNVNSACLTTTVARQLRPARVEGLKVLTIAGEAPTQEILDTWADKVCLMNMYGPAECTIYSTGVTNISVNDHPQNIGRGVGARLWIADPHDHNLLTPIGVVGELLIEGPILARSYLKDEAKTNTAFIQDPPWLQEEQGDQPHRLYKTGDLVRYAPDGSIVYLGRKDTQVKVRGQRVELGEIEHQIQRCTSGSLEVAVEVVTPADAGGKSTLAGFICVGVDTDVVDELNMVLTTPAACQRLQTIIQDIQPRLRQVLPGYMVPSGYVPLSRMPISASAKTDRKRLRQLASTLSMRHLTAFSAPAMERRPPSTALEKRLHKLWAENLKIDADTIGIDDNFFQLGGDSVTAMRLVAAVRDLGVSLTVDSIFKNPTLASMAVTARPAEFNENDIPPFGLLKDRAEENYLRDEALTQCGILAESIEDIYPCTPWQASIMDWSVNWPVSGKGPGATFQVVYDMPANLDIRRFSWAWDMAAHAHPILRTRIITTPLGSYQVVLGYPVLWNYTEDLDSYLEENRNKAIGFGESLHRCTVVLDKHSGRRHFVWTVQHAIYDGWSLALLFPKISHFYTGGTHGNDHTEFNQFIQTILRIDKAECDKFWSSQLAGICTRPFYEPPHHHQTYNDGQLSTNLRLPEYERSEVTLATTIYAAWALTMAQYSRSEEVVLRLPRTGRDAPVRHVDVMIAPTVTHIPLRICIIPSQKTSDFLSAIQQRTTDTIPYTFAGYSNIRQLSPDARKACDSAMQFIFHTEDTEKSIESLAGCRLRSITRFVCDATPFSLEIFRKAEGLKASACFDTGLFYRHGVQALLEQFEDVLRQFLLADGKHEVQDIEISPIEDTYLYRLSHASESNGES